VSPAGNSIDSSDDPRSTDAAFDWVEDLLGGTIVERRLQARWRPHWFLTVRDQRGNDHRVMLRGFRNGGYLGDEVVTRAWLRREAGVLRTLQPTPVKVPRFFGYHDELDWLLMEWVQGDELLTDVEDDDRRDDLFREYLDTIVDLHTLDVSRLDLAPDMVAPPTPDLVLQGSLDMAIGLFRTAAPADPEPLLELGIWWAKTHKPQAPHETRLCGGDVGPNQFIFDDTGVKSMFDLELAHLGDPYEDLGLMRMREMCYPIGRLPAHLQYYAERTGSSLEIDALRYWTVIGMLTGPLWCWERVQRPDPLLPDQVPIFSWDPIYRRGLAEALMEIYDIALDPPAPLLPVETTRNRLHELLTGQVRDVYLPAADDPSMTFRLRGTLALSETVELGNTIGAQLERDDIDELGELLGHRPMTRREGLAAVEVLVRADPERDIERRLRCFHRMQVRHEFLFAPIQASMGFASNEPLARLQ